MLYFSYQRFAVLGRLCSQFQDVAVPKITFHLFKGIIQNFRKILTDCYKFTLFSYEQNSNRNECIHKVGIYNIKI